MFIFKILVHIACFVCLTGKCTSPILPNTWVLMHSSCQGDIFTEPGEINNIAKFKLQLQIEKFVIAENAIIADFYSYKLAFRPSRHPHDTKI